MKLVILDRDGVINEDTPYYIKSAEEWRPIAGSLEAIAKFNHAGYTVVIATNQSGVGRGYFTAKALDEIHAKMRRELAKVGGKIDHIYFCPHTPDDNCDCRKPKTGMFEQIMHDYGLRDLKSVINVGDALRDIQIGQIFGCRNILVLTGKGQKTLQDNPNISAEIFQNLAAVVNSLV
ncbi:MAG: D-glycero-beta-D-manno-heptose 1,7-bisphosphate 7-phosphatase [Gammaproteobacteria bacterium]|jgi:D-glycero-D-manno-heptose 1,7-bisphosphate phosphatase